LQQSGSRTISTVAIRPSSYELIMWRRDRARDPARRSALTQSGHACVSLDRRHSRPRLETTVRRTYRVPNGRQLVTLEDAGNYITKLPKAKHTAPEWQAAMEALLLVVTHNGPTMFARIGMMKALNSHVERTFNSSRKETHWGKRKLKRDL
jgi:hypothetical protein